MCVASWAATSIKRVQVVERCTGEEAAVLNSNMEAPKGRRGWIVAGDRIEEMRTWGTSMRRRWEKRTPEARHEVQVTWLRLVGQNSLVSLAIPGAMYLISMLSRVAYKSPPRLDKEGPWVQDLHSYDEPLTFGGQCQSSRPDLWHHWWGVVC